MEKEKTGSFANLSVLRVAGWDILNNGTNLPIVVHGE